MQSHNATSTITLIKKSSSGCSVLKCICANMQVAYYSSMLGTSADEEINHEKWTSMCQEMVYVKTWWIPQ